MVGEGGQLDTDITYRHIRSCLGMAYFVSENKTHPERQYIWR